MLSWPHKLSINYYLYYYLYYYKLPIISIHWQVIHSILSYSSKSILSYLINAVNGPWEAFWNQVPLCMFACSIHSFIHSGYFYSASSSPLLLIGAPDTARIGAIHKVRHARGGGGPRMCDSLWQGEGSRAYDVMLIHFLSYIWNMKFKVMFNFLM